MQVYNVAFLCSNGSRNMSIACGEEDTLTLQVVRRVGRGKEMKIVPIKGKFKIEFKFSTDGLETVPPGRRIVITDRQGKASLKIKVTGLKYTSVEGKAWRIK